MPSYQFEIRPGGDSSGTCAIGGRELGFYNGSSPGNTRPFVHLGVRDFNPFTHSYRARA